MRLKKYFLVILVISLCYTNIQFNNTVYADDYDEENADTLIFDKNDLQVSASPTKEPVLSSRAAVVIDRNTGLILYGKNCKDIRKMASTTKIMTAIVVIENTSNLYETVTVSKKAAAVGGSRVGLHTGDKITVNDLLYGLMLKSGNDAAVALAETVGGSVEDFAVLMNNKANELGLENTHFVTPHGLDNEEHYTTAYELAQLANYALNNKKFREIVGTKNYTLTLNGNSMNVSNGNELLGNFMGVYGVKTGFTNGANRCLVTACKRDNIDVISVVLGADTKNIRTRDSMNVLNYVFQNFKYINIEDMVNKEFNEWNTDNFIEIIKGNEPYIELKLGNIKYSQILVNKNNMDKINININCTEVIEAPIYENVKIGEIKVELNEEEILKADILVKKSIDRKGILNYLHDILENVKIMFVSKIF